MDFFFIALIPLALLAINRYFMQVDRDNKIAIEEAKVRAAMMLRDAQEDLRRQQHERQLAELRAIGDAKTSALKPKPVVIDAPQKTRQHSAEPSVSPDSFESTPSLKVASQTMMSVPREHLADMGVFVEEEREQQF